MFASGASYKNWHSTRPHKPTAGYTKFTEIKALITFYARFLVDFTANNNAAKNGSHFQCWGEREFNALYSIPSSLIFATENRTAAVSLMTPEVTTSE